MWQHIHTLKSPNAHPLIEHTPILQPRHAQAWICRKYTCFWLIQLLLIHKLRPYHWSTHLTHRTCCIPLAQPKLLQAARKGLQKTYMSLTQQLEQKRQSLQASAQRQVGRHALDATTVKDC